MEGGSGAFRKRERASLVASLSSGSSMYVSVARSLSSAASASALTSAFSRCALARNEPRPMPAINLVVKAPNPTHEGRTQEGFEVVLTHPAMRCHVEAASAAALAGYLF